MNNIIFQILDWSDFQEEDDEGDKTYYIRLFGRTKKQETVYLQIEGFKPYFYVEINESIAKSVIKISSLIEQVKERVSKDKQNDLFEYKVKTKHKFYGFTNYKKFYFLKLLFNSYDAMIAYSRVFTYGVKINYKICKFNVFETNIKQYLRFMHIRDIEAVGWIRAHDLEEFDTEPTICDYNYKTDWKNIHKVDDQTIEKFTIASFDIECTSEDGSFPQPTRDNDKVIQIGVTMSLYGETECYERYLLSLDETNDIDNAKVIWFKTEQELLLGFRKLIEEINPDIITGYNIFGFDFEYLMKRSEKLGIKNKFSRLSRIRGEMSNWVEKQLASSAMGQNLLKYYEMTGRVIIDLMKVVQRDYSLSSYKLDHVASHFIRDIIMNINDENKIIQTRNTYGLEVGQYIIISVKDNSIETNYNDGEKYEITELGKDYIKYRGVINVNDDIFKQKNIKIFWCLAKNDVSPSYIFENYFKSSEYRTIIGKYCLVDCMLCNKLISKLQIITNNVSMANVCNVPFSYLFLRGQGIKIFSLVAKKCREKQHLIPVVKKKIIKDEDKDNKPKNKKLELKKKEKEKQKQKELNEQINKNVFDLINYENFANKLNSRNKNDEGIDDDDGYEGAIVFDPEPGVYYSPIIVLDYASLYPNSMIFRNLSHECFVNDTEYNNLEDCKYHNITFKNTNGEDITCTFAEKQGVKGIIPEILMYLLSERKKYKKLKEIQTDPFLKSIMDSRQLAYKVTANSLYGQTGASTSSICMKEIAASTTATGREMLLFSKYFIENIYSKLINLALHDKDKFIEQIHAVLKYYPNDMIVYTKNAENPHELIKHNVHINTNVNEIIPDTKFVRKNIGYENEIKFDEQINNVFNDFNKNKFNKIENYTIVKRDEFVKLLKRVIINNSSKIERLYTDYYDIWNDLDIYSHKKLKKKLNLITNKEHFVQQIKYIVDEIGYKNKDEFIEKFYISMNNLLDGYNVKNKIIYGDSVTGHTPLLLRQNNKIIIKTIESLGKKWLCYNQDKLQDDNINYEVWTDKGWSKIKRVIKHKTNKQIYGINTHGGYVEVTEDHSLLTDCENIIKPNECEIGTKLLCSMTNYNEQCDEYCNDATIDNLIFTDQIDAMKSYMRLIQQGYNSYNINVNIYTNNTNMYELKIIENKTNNAMCAIKKIIKLSCETRWVYDLETRNHHFQAGIGDIIVHNTDSVFFCPHIKDDETMIEQKDKNALEKSIHLGIWASLFIGILLPPPMSQEFEKVLYPFIIQGKKRYVGNLYEKNPNKFYQKSMGIELRRRDNAPIVKIILSGVIDEILNKNSSEGAWKFAKKSLQDIIDGKFSINNFIISKSLKGNALSKNEREFEEQKDPENRFYKDRTRIVHAVLADRIADRDYGNRPMTNDRIAYAYICTTKDVKLQGERVETPEYIIENKLKLDYKFYIEHQIKNALLRFLDLIIYDAEKLINNILIKEENRQNRIKPIKYYQDKLTYSTKEKKNKIKISLNSTYKPLENKIVSKQEEKQKNKKNIEKMTICSSTIDLFN